MRWPRLARGHQALEHRELALAVASCCFERIEHGGQFRHLRRIRAADLAAFGPPVGGGWSKSNSPRSRFGQVGDAAAERVEADQVGIHACRCATRAHRPCPAAARGRPAGPCAARRSPARAAALQRPGHEAAELHAGGKDRGRHQQRRRRRRRTASAEPSGRPGGRWPARPETICRFIAAHNLLAAVENGRGLPASGQRCVTVQAELGWEQTSPAGSPHVSVGAREVDPPSRKSADYDRTGLRLAIRKTAFINYRLTMADRLRPLFSGRSPALANCAKQAAEAVVARDAGAPGTARTAAGRTSSAPCDALTTCRGHGRFGRLVRPRALRGTAARARLPDSASR